MLALVLPIWSQQEAGKKPPVLPKAPAGVVIEENVAYLEAGHSETADLYLHLKSSK